MTRLLLAAIMVAITVACCADDCEQRDIDSCAIQYEVCAADCGEAFCDCLDWAGCRGSCAWTKAGCE